MSLNPPKEVTDGCSQLELLLIIGEEDYDLAIEVRAWRGQAPIACPEEEDLQDYIDRDVQKLSDMVNKNLFRPYPKHLFISHLMDTTPCDHNFQALRDWWYPIYIDSKDKQEKLAIAIQQMEDFLNNLTVYDVLRRFPELNEHINVYSDKQGQEHYKPKDGDIYDFHWRDGRTFALYFKVLHKL